MTQQTMDMSKLRTTINALLDTGGAPASPKKIPDTVGLSTDRVAGQLDFLELFGVVMKDADGGYRLAGVNASLVLGSLREFSAANRPLLDDLSKHGNGKTWVRVLFELESRRQQLRLTNPIRHVKAAMAAIVGEWESRRYVLLEHVHGPGWERFKFIGGKREATETFSSEVVQREMAEEIQRDVREVLTLANDPIVMGYQFDEISRTRGVLTHYEAVVFGVAEFTDRPLTYTGSSGRILVWLPVSEYLKRVRAGDDAFTKLSSRDGVQDYVERTDVLYRMRDDDQKRILTQQ